MRPLLIRAGLCTALCIGLSGCSASPSLGVQDVRNAVNTASGIMNTVKTTTRDAVNVADQGLKMVESGASGIGNTANKIRTKVDKYTGERRSEQGQL